MGNNLITSPFSNDVVQVVVEPGHTVVDILQSANIPYAVWDQVVVTLNCKELLRDQWDILHVREDDVVSIFITQMSGNSGKTILRLVAVILVAVFAQWASPYLATSTGGIAGVAAGITVVGTLAINALIPPAQVDMATGSAAASSYFLTGQQNRARFYENIPIVYGTHKIIANLASGVDVFNAGTSSIFSGVYDFGLGGVTLSQIKIGDTDIETLDGVTRILKREPTLVSASQPELGLNPVLLNLVAFPIKYQELSLALDDAGQTAISTTSAGCDTVVIEIAFPRGLVRIDDQGAELNTQVTYEIDWKPSSGVDWYKPPAESRVYAGDHLRVFYDSIRGFGGVLPFVGTGPVSEGAGSNSTIEADITVSRKYVVNDGAVFTVHVEFRGFAYRVVPDDSAFTIYDPDTGGLFTGGSISGGVIEIIPGQVYEFNMVFNAGFQGRAQLRLDTFNFKPKDTATTPEFESAMLVSPAWRIDMVETAAPPEGDPIPAPPPPALGPPRYSDVAGDETYVQLIEFRKYPYTGAFQKDGNTMELYIKGVSHKIFHTDESNYLGELVRTGAVWIEGEFEYRIAWYATKYYPVEVNTGLLVLQPIFTPPEPGLDPFLNSRVFTVSGDKALFGVVSVVIPFPEQGQYDIRVIRKTAAPADNRTINGSTWVKINSRGTTVGNDPRSVLNLKKQHTLLEIQFEANENISGNIQQLSAIARGEVRPHAGGWGPARITSNPAWIVLDILTGYSIQNHQDIPTSHLFDGGWIKDEQIDFTAFATLATLCDEPVSYVDIQGNNLTRPRYACNLLTNTSAPIIETVQSILAMARCQLIINQQGLYSILFDDIQTTPRQLFTPQNSWGFTGSRAFQEIPHAFHVEFTSPELGYQVGTNTIYRPGYDALNATIFETLQTYGITNWHQASWYGMYMLAQGYIRSEIFTLNCDLENLVIQRGDMVHIQHDVPLLGGTACLVSRDSSTNRVYVDQELGTFGPPMGFTLRQLDGTVVTGDVIATGPDWVEMSIARQTNQGEVFVVGTQKADGKVTDPYLITAITPKSNLQAEISMVRYDETVYGTDWGQFPIWNPSFGASPSGETDLYTYNLKGFANFKLIDRQPFSTTQLTWDIGPANQQDTCRAIGITYRKAAGSPIIPLIQLDGDARNWLHEYSSVDPKYGKGLYTVQPISNLGFYGRSQTLDMGQVVDSEPPVAPINLIANYVISTVTTTLTWELNVEPDMNKYMIYSSTVDNGVANATYITSTQHDVNELIMLVGTPEYYYVVAVDTSGNESPASMILSTEVPVGKGSNGAGYVPDFTPGYVGGVSDFIYILNRDATNLPNDGEILVHGQTLEHPDGTTVVNVVTPWSIYTPYEGAEKGDIFIMYTAEDPLTRWTGSISWGLNQSNFVVAVWDDSNLWRVREDDGTYWTFATPGVPLITDCIFAVAYKLGDLSTGIESIIPLTSGLVGADGADGSQGIGARAVDLTFTEQSIVYDPSPVPPTVTFTAAARNAVGTPYYSFYINNIVQQEGLSNSYVYTNPGTYDGMPVKVEVELREDGLGPNPVLATDQTTLYGIKAGADAILVLFDNEAHTLPTTNLGVVDYTGSGASVKVKQGEVDLTYVSGLPVAGQWTFTSVLATDITVGSITGDGTLIATVADHSLMTANIAFIEFLIEGRRINGEAFSGYLTKQTLAKSLQGADGVDGIDGADGADGSAGADARGISLSAASLTFLYDVYGLNPYPISALITSLTINVAIGAVPYFKYYLNDIAQSPSPVKNNNVFNYIPQADFNNMPDKLEVELYEGTDTSYVDVVLARDQVTLSGLLSGSDGLTVSMSNEAHTLVSAYDGSNPEYIGSGSEFRVWEGAVPYAYDDILPYGPNTFYVIVDPVWVGQITPGAITGSGDIATMANHSNMLDNNVTIDLLVISHLVDGSEVVTPKVQSLSKSLGGVPGLDGADGIDGAAGADGAAGVDSRSVDLTFDAQVFIYDPDPVPASATFTATAFNTSGALTYRFLVDNIEVQFTAANTYVYTPRLNYVDMPDSVEVELWEDGALVSRDQVSAYGVRPGDDAVSILLTNEAHTLPVTNLGVVTYIGSGTDVQVFQGSVPLIYQTAAPASGEWTLTAVNPSNITVGAISGAGTDKAIVGQHSNMTANVAFVQFVIDGKLSNGVVFSALIRVQSLSKSIEGADGADGVSGADGADGADGVTARAVSLSSESLVFEYDASGVNPLPTSAIVTATPVNITAGAYTYYRYFINDVAQTPITRDDNQFTYVPDPQAINMPEKFEVEIYEGTLGGVTTGVLARDQITMSALKVSLDGITNIVSNEAHTLPVDAGGTITYTGSGTDFNCWEGGVAVPYSSTLAASPSFKVQATSWSSITPYSSPYTVSTYIRRYGNHSNMTADRASITYTITVKTSTGVQLVFTKVQSFGKSIAGVDGIDGVSSVTAALTNPSPIVSTDTLGFQYPTYIDVNEYITASKGIFQVIEGNTDITEGNGVSYSVVGGVGSSVSYLTQNGATFAILTDTGEYKIRVTGTPPESWKSDSETFTVRAVYGALVFDRNYTISKVIAAFSSVKIQTTNVSFATFGGISTAEFKLDNNGNEYERENLGNITGWTQIGAPGWKGSGNSSLYSVYATLISGTPYNGTFDTWLGLEADRIWGVRDTVQDGVHATLEIKLEIRLDATEIILTTRTVTIDAYNNPTI